jgi:hypothetical protein
LAHGGSALDPTFPAALFDQVGYMPFLHHPATGVWLLLVIATLVSWWLGVAHGLHTVLNPAAITGGVMMIAFIKVRFVIRYFMEARDAPLPVRLIGDAWIAGVYATLMCIYVFA